MVDTSDDWIITRTGIKERRIAAKDENTSDMAAKAGLKAIEQAKISPKEIDLIIVGRPLLICFPGHGVLRSEEDRSNQRRLFDISAACAGFLFAWRSRSSSLRHIPTTLSCDRSRQIDIDH